MGELHFFLVIALPTAFLGVYTKYTIPIILMLAIVSGLWICAINFSKKNKHRISILYIGVYSFIFSWVLLLASYKLFAMANIVSAKITVLLLCCYMISLITYNIYVVRLICKGQLSINSNKKSSTLILIFSVFGIGFGKILANDINSNDQAFVVLGLICMVLSLFLVFGTDKLLKYYFMVKLDVFEISDDNYKI